MSLSSIFLVIVEEEDVRAASLELDFAEDSLRGYRDHVRDMEEENQIGPSTGARRQVTGAQISTPILRDNTLNW